MMSGPCRCKDGIEIDLPVSHCECHREHQFAIKSGIQLPEHRQWKDEDDHVNDNVEGRYALEYDDDIQTMALNFRIPLLTRWTAVENGRKNGRDPPANNEGARNPDTPTKDSRVSKNPCVEE